MQKSFGRASSILVLMRGVLNWDFNIASQRNQSIKLYYLSNYLSKGNMASNIPIFLHSIDKVLLDEIYLLCSILITESFLAICGTFGLHCWGEVSTLGNFELVQNDHTR